MPITIHAYGALKTSQNYVGSITEYSTETLILYIPVLPSLSNPPQFSWISPTGLRFAERQMFREPSLDITDGGTVLEYAFTATIYPVMTAGLIASQTSGKSLFSFRLGPVFSPIVKVNVDKSIFPEQTELPPTAAEELQTQINLLKDRVALLEE